MLLRSNGIFMAARGHPDAYELASRVANMTPHVRDVKLLYCFYSSCELSSDPSKMETRS